MKCIIIDDEAMARAIITQFDKIASGYTTGKRSAVGKDATISTRDGSQIAETAGMIKKRERQKSKKEAGR